MQFDEMFLHLHVLKKYALTLYYAKIYANYIPQLYFEVMVQRFP